MIQSNWTRPSWTIFLSLNVEHNHCCSLWVAAKSWAMTRLMQPNILSLYFPQAEAQNEVACRETNLPKSCSHCHDPCTCVVLLACNRDSVLTIVSVDQAISAPSNPPASKTMRWCYKTSKKSFHRGTSSHNLFSSFWTININKSIISALRSSSVVSSLYQGCMKSRNNNAK